MTAEPLTHEDEVMEGTGACRAVDVRDIEDDFGDLVKRCNVTDILLNKHLAEARNFRDQVQTLRDMVPRNPTAAQLTALDFVIGLMKRALTELEEVE